MIHYIGSCTESQYGVGSLINFREDELKNVSLVLNVGWFVTTTEDRVFECYDVMKLSSTADIWESPCREGF